MKTYNVITHQNIRCKDNSDRDHNLVLIQKYGNLSLNYLLPFLVWHLKHFYRTNGLVQIGTWSNTEMIEVYDKYEPNHTKKGTYIYVKPTFCLSGVIMSRESFNLSSILICNIIIVEYFFNQSKNKRVLPSFLIENLCHDPSLLETLLDISILI